MKENIYTNMTLYYTITYCLILVCCMIIVVFLGVLFKYLRLRRQFRKEARELKTSFLRDSQRDMEGSDDEIEHDTVTESKS